ncbi:hypothetical protein C0J52_06077 [Blattella germanica]|nr:hypothetical protein C0J52_06077 [Blattella germanica]
MNTCIIRIDYFWMFSNYFIRYIFLESRTVAQWTKAVCFESGSRDARWFESPWGKKFPHGFRPVYGTGAHPAS